MSWLPEMRDGVSRLSADDLGRRNRYVLRVLLSVIAVLMVAALLIGIRW